MKYLLLLTYTVLFLFAMKDTKAQMVQHEFSYYSETAKNVSVAGSLNNWSADALQMKKVLDNTWKATLQTKPGYCGNNRLRKKVPGPIYFSVIITSRRSI